MRCRLGTRRARWRACWPAAWRRWISGGCAIRWCRRASSPRWTGSARRELCCIAVREGAQLLGLLPLFRERVRLSGVPVERVAFLGDGATGCDYLDVLAAPGCEADVRDAVLEGLGDLSWDLCDLDGLWRESATALQVAQRFPNGRAVDSAAAGLGGARAQVVRDSKVRFVCPHLPL